MRSYIISTLFALTTLFSLNQTAEAQRVRPAKTAKVKTNATTAKVKTNAKAKIRPKHYLPKGNEAGTRWWGNQHGHGYKMIEKFGTEIVRETGTFRADGSRRAKTVRDKTGEVQIEYYRGTVNSTIVRQKNGDWIRHDSTKTGLTRVTSSNGPKSSITYTLPGNMQISFAQKQAQKYANDKGKPVKLDFGGQRKTEVYFPQTKSRK